MTALSRRPVTCSSCGSVGHNRRRCNGHGAPPSAARSTRVPEAKVRTAPIVAPFAPAAVQAGQRFVVGEDLEDEDMVATWRLDETWEAIEPLLPGDPAWQLRRVSDGALQLGVPSLWPFIRETPGPLPPATSPSFGFGRVGPDDPFATAQRLAAQTRRKQRKIAVTVPGAP